MIPVKWIVFQVDDLTPAPHIPFVYRSKRSSLESVGFDESCSVEVLGKQIDDQLMFVVVIQLKLGVAETFVERSVGIRCILFHGNSR